MKLTNVVLPAFLVGLLCLVTTGALRQIRISNDSQLPNEVVVAQGDLERGPVRMIRFVLLENALYPRSMRVDKGLVNLLVEDETGVSEGLVVERVVNNNHERMTTIRRQPNVRRGRELLRLTPGRYIVYDASKPDNKAELMVEP